VKEQTIEYAEGTSAKVVTVRRKRTIYERFVKRPLDIICALLAIICFCWLYAIVAILVKIKLGSPVLFKQMRPGFNEKIFPLYKFRTMTDERDENGELLPDEVRLTKFGKWLRSTSLDELPEAFNILNGTMSVIGPRPQLVRDMVFMTPDQRRRHCVKPGLSGQAQVNGRNGISWEEKLDWDLKYIEKITFIGDLRIIGQTVMKAFIKQEGVVREGTASDMDFGDYLLSKGVVSKEEYDKRQEVARALLTNRK
jgi:lipopolysaccharide/colanic/teichoic acid biosynthesis glycosyltransferase